jgi:demethylmenaquinone methyltransferase/2-methoxy-6-polyprenyl-1,4-benzoquinol methylase
MATTKPSEHDSLLEQTYKWMHQHFPHIVDCQPIPVEQFLKDAGFQLDSVDRLTIFTMPVVAAVAST